MARLIPSFIDDQTPPGERDVFNLLATGPDDWVALHSLDLAPWNRGLRTEIDFLVIVPDTGMLCIEVKSHERISFEEDRWFPPEIRRSPFKQASDGRHTFFRRLRELAPRFKAVPVVHCCIFPRASFDLDANLSVQPWELIDGRRFRSFVTGSDFCRDLRSRMERSIESDERLRRMEDVLSSGDVDVLVACCVPVQRRRPGAREEIRRREEESERVLRVQQKPVLQLVALNDRLVVDGAAGTGKTLIAMEVARRQAEGGRRVALVCFNQLVGEWLVQRLKASTPPLPNLFVGRAIRMMAGLAGVEIPAEPSPRYWETDLPDLLETQLTDPDFKAAAEFDYLVVDEAQDLLARPRLWHCLTQFLDGGLERGRFALFGDFENQVLTERSVIDDSLEALRRTSGPARWRLTENCRNYRIVGETAVRLAGLDERIYAGYLRTGGSVRSYDITFYESERAQLDQLSLWLREFRSEGYRGSEVSILSFLGMESCAARRLAEEGETLRPAWQGGGSPGYASVHAFKGMENKVVLLTDVVLRDEEVYRHLFYTGMTRALEAVRILCDAGSKGILTRWLSSGGEA